MNLPGSLVDTSQQTTNLKNSVLGGPIIYGVAALVSLVGLFDAIYLTIGHVTGRSLRCTIVTGCDEVLSSPYATVLGIPLALIGAVAYFTCFSLATLAAFGYRTAGKLLTLIVALMFLTTLALLYLQAFVIGHFCQFCLISAAATFALAALLLARRFNWPTSLRSRGSGR
ncbi:MAG TPA: vitamin K epoxide reductase family protein [Pyrinomonadaceae bacterium]|nr:vitamin K epoxide reductase family protein [Pyrinomonadaceae bacterium]